MSDLRQAKDELYNFIVENEFIKSPRLITQYKVLIGNFEKACKQDALKQANEQPKQPQEQALPLNSVMPCLPTVKEMINESKLYATTIINETDYTDKRIHLEYAFKNGYNYLYEFLNKA